MSVSRPQLVVYVGNIRSEYEVRSLSSNVHVTAVQFTRPFAYSSSTWVVEDHQHCDKDVTHFMPADVDATTAGNWSAVGDHAADERDVMVTTRSARAPYKYVIKSADDPPHMKLTIPGTLPLSFVNASATRAESLFVSNNLCFQ